MKTLPILAAATLLLLSLPLAAAEEEFACHSWEVFVGDRYGTGAGVSTEDGAAYVGTDAVPTSFYFVYDGPPVLHPWIWSFWIATEENGEPGLQRGDDMCDDGQDEHGADCLLSCTF